MSYKKIWGVTTPLIVTPMFEMHKLHIQRGMECSLHTHRFKHNAFYILAGELFLDSIVGDMSGTPVEGAKLVADDHFTIAPGVWHKFRTADLPCVALEMYYTEPLSEDIIRRTTGGPVNR